MKIALACASLGAPDFARDPCWLYQLVQRAGIAGARGLTGDNAGQDGDGFMKQRAAIEYPPESKKGWSAICEIETDGTPDIIYVSGDLAWNSSFTGADYGSLTPLELQQSDALAFKNALTSLCPSSRQIYLSFTPPDPINYGGAVWTPGASTFAQLDAYCKTLWAGNAITIDYALFAATLGTMDGVHEAYGVNLLIANDVFWLSQGLGVDFGTKSPNYAPYDGSQGSTAICANIKARNMLGLAFLSSNNIDPARIPAP